MKRWCFCVVLLGVLVTGLSGCATGGAPVVEQSIEARPTPSTYKVRKGDTLYSIAWRFDRDYVSLARLNGIKSPYQIHPGQTLKLKASTSTASRSASQSSSASSSRASSTRTSKPAASNRPAPAPAKPSGQWVWPAKGSVARGYGKGNKGIDVAVTTGTPVVSVAAGKVVYAGVGLRGYRHLVIVKHDSRYLSAYSLNDTPRVGEGAAVKAGGLLADIKGRGTAAVVHFEIRRDGQPIDPRSVIRTR